MPARIIPRAAWGARRPKTTPITVPITARSATCVHHAGATPVNIRSVADAYAYVRVDQDYHMDSNGWDDIGYNYLVASAPGTPADGMILEGRGRDVVGAHCLNWNTPWIGVQVATGGTAARGDQRPSPAALASVRWLHDGFGIAARHNLAMKAHSDGFATECPGPILLAWVRSGMPATAQSGPATPWPSPAKPPATPAAPATEEDIMKPWFLRRKDGAIVIVGPTGARSVTPEQWRVWQNLGYKTEKGMDAMDSGPWTAVIESLGGMAK